jgi:hypothetical protein
MAKSSNDLPVSKDYLNTLQDLKQQIQEAKARGTFTVNPTLITFIDT